MAPGYVFDRERKKFVKVDCDGENQGRWARW